MGFGGAQRRLPTGGAAKGTPKNASVPVSESNKPTKVTPDSRLSSGER